MNKLPLACKLRYAKLFNTEFLLCYADVAPHNSVTDHCNTIYFSELDLLQKYNVYLFSVGLLPVSKDREVNKAF
jgi:hypothetical protein